VHRSYSMASDAGDGSTSRRERPLQVQTRISVGESNPCDGLDGAGKPTGCSARTTSPPSLVDHCSLPWLAGRQHFVLSSAYLRLHDFKLTTDEQAYLPPELMAEEQASGLAFVLGQDKQIAEFEWESVPIVSLEDIRHGLASIADGWHSYFLIHRSVPTTIRRFQSST
jgi:hypothetical protein